VLRRRAAIKIYRIDDQLSNIKNRFCLAAVMSGIETETHRFVQLEVADGLEMVAETVAAEVLPVLPTPLVGGVLPPTDLRMAPAPSGQSIVALRIGKCTQYRNYDNETCQCYEFRIHYVSFLESWDLLHFFFTVVYNNFVFVLAMNFLSKKNVRGHFTL